MSERIRAFIAIELNKEIHDYLANIQNELKQARADVKWVKPENIHLTLKFLGNMDISQINQIKKILAEISQGENEFSIELSRVGAFPKLKYPRAIWIGIEKNQDKVTEIANNLEERLHKLGISKEDRPFHPHITIGRVKSSLNRSTLAEKLTSINIPQRPSMTIKKLTLFKSTLTPNGPIYQVLNESNFKAT